MSRPVVISAGCNFGGASVTLQVLPLPGSPAPAASTSAGIPGAAASAAQGETVRVRTDLFVAGDWTGTSLCTNLDLLPGCHDETVLYHFTPRGENKVHLVADKIVDGKPESMGEFDMTQNGSLIISAIVAGQVQVGTPTWPVTLQAVDSDVEAQAA